MPFQQETLTSYRVRVLRELRDASQQFFNNQGSATPYADIDAWINEGMRWRDLWAKPARKYAPNIALTQALDQYTLHGTGGLFPTDTVLDIVNLWLIYGNLRGRLEERSFGEVTDAYRPWLQYSDIPAAYARYGASQIFVASAPSGPMGLDFDVCVLSATLVLPADVDPQPYPYTEPVVKYAAYLAKQNQRRFDESGSFFNEARQWIDAIDGSKTGMLPAPMTGKR